ncbi:MAG: CDP-diacylglycerol--glycerol-3-phosphate 3-phosphatidyltransferase [Clostridiales bacterium]|nr:CDP-diacylglycerol--glycerol-3-phosphate 3-phosphatidyltransferase [Clostridiales bacterium]
MPLKMNIPNALSLLRLILVPVFALVFFSELEGAYLIAGGIFLFAGITDVLDGYIARKYNMITRLGRILDPLADKLMQVTAFVCMAIAKLIPVWVILILAAKELIMLLGGSIILKRCNDVPSSNIYGKAASAVFYVVTLLIIAFPIPQLVSKLMLFGALALSILAMVIYGYRNRRLLRHNRKEENSKTK